MQRLAQQFAARHPKSIARSIAAAERISDLQFTRTYRVPFPFSRYFREHLKLGGFVAASDGVTVTDLDGQRFYDLTGSYGVNVFGYDFYKTCIAEGRARAKHLGPVLGSLHPCVTWNDTAAVMPAVRLARYHTRRNYLVRFCGPITAGGTMCRPAQAIRSHRERSIR